jgi:hypothetical protein
MSVGMVYVLKEQDSSAIIADRLDDQDSISGRAGIFLFSTTSSPPLGSLYVSVESLPVVLSLGMRLLKCEADH